MKEIQLTKGMVALVDDVDCEVVECLSWHATKMGNNWYARHQFSDSRIVMHRFILNVVNKPWIEIDHKDGNGLNNQRSNLRFATTQENGFAFRRKPHGTTSRFRGVYLNKRWNRWGASIMCNGKRYWIGSFDTENEAAQERDRVAVRLNPEFASLTYKP